MTYTLAHRRWACIGSIAAFTAFAGTIALLALYAGEEIRISYTYTAGGFDDSGNPKGGQANTATVAIIFLAFTLTVFAYIWICCLVIINVKNARVVFWCGIRERDSGGYYSSDTGDVICGYVVWAIPILITLIVSFSMNV